MGRYDISTLDKMLEVNPNDLLGHIFCFHGAHTNMLKLDNLTFEAVENQSDGYRSMMERLRLVESSRSQGFFAHPLCTVVVCKPNLKLNVYELRDTKTDHVWLTFGTRNSDPYYPMFIFNYTPPTSLL